MSYLPVVSVDTSSSVSLPNTPTNFTAPGDQAIPELTLTREDGKYVEGVITGMIQNIPDLSQSEVRTYPLAMQFRASGFTKQDAAKYIEMQRSGADPAELGTFLGNNFEFCEE